MRKTKDSPWRVPVWAPGLGEAKQIVADYAAMIASLPGIRGIWAPWERETLSIYTLIDPENEETENALYDAEKAIRAKWPDAPVNFYVSMDVSGFAEGMKEAFEPSLVPLR